ncbi:MAG: T9SS type A sorting domain-containing protein [Bacteroidota bacterium]|nr:T9SS type A sorting domain-containing protein [Bacteroidota bacterium]
MSARSFLLLIGSVVISVQANAQEHPFISEFNLSETANAVDLEWTMVAGNTCVGITILRSLDSLYFEPVGSIEGICGNIIAPVGYQFTDATAPELSILFYRLELGSAGSSSIQKIELQRLRSSEHRFQPSPVSDQGEILLNVDPQIPVQIDLFNVLGEQVGQVNGRGGRHIIEVLGWDQGLYIYQVSIEGKRSSGKFVVQ